MPSPVRPQKTSPLTIGGAQTDATDVEIGLLTASAGRVNRVGRNTVAGTIGKIVTMVLGFAVTPTLLTELGTTQFGLYAIVISVQSYFGLFDLGIGSGLSRFMITQEAAGDETGVRRITSFGMLYYVALAALLFPAVYLLAPSVVHWLKVPSGLAGQAILAIYYLFGLFMSSSALGMIGARLYAAQRMDLSALSGVMSSALFTATVLLVVPHFPNLLAALACSAVPVISSALINVWSLRLIGVRSLFANPFRLPRSALTSLLSFGAWTQVNSLTAVINLEADKLLISHFLGTANVAPYQVGNRYALLSRALPLTLLGALYPDITARLSRGLAGEQFESLYQESLRALMLSTLTIVGFLVAVTRPFISAWIGHPLPGAEAIAIALLLSYAVNNLTGVGTTIVRAEGRPQFETYYAVASAMLNVGATIVLTPRYGLWGVVGGTIIGNVVGSLGFMVLFHVRSRLPVGRTVLSWLAPLLVGVAAAAAVTSSLNSAFSALPLPGGRWGHMAVVAGSGLIYLLVLVLSLFVVRFWRNDDFAVVRALRARIFKS